MPRLEEQVEEQEEVRRRAIIRRFHRRLSLRLIGSLCVHGLLAAIKIFFMSPLFFFDLRIL
jgi:hypothetical protein